MTEINDTVTLGLKGVLQQVSALATTISANAALHVAEAIIWGDDANTAKVYLGGPRMAVNSPNTNPPANYSAALDGTINPYSEGGGGNVNTVHLTTWWVLSTADNQKIHIKTRVA